MANTHDSKACGFTALRVQVPLPAPIKDFKKEGDKPSFFLMQLNNIYKSFPEYDRLKLLFIKGKSGTILPGPAWPTAAQFKKDESRASTLFIFPSKSVATK